jgi:hypothetical protein
VLILSSAGGTGILQHLVAYGGRNDHLFRAGENWTGFEAPIVLTVLQLLFKAAASTTCHATGTSQLSERQIIEHFSTRQAVTTSLDGTFMTAHPVELFDKGKQISVPLLMGGELVLLMFEITEMC